MTAVVVGFSLEILERSIFLNDHSGELQFISLLTLGLKEYFRHSSKDAALTLLLFSWCVLIILSQFGTRSLKLLF